VDFLSKSRILIASFLLALIISVSCVPADADKIITTSSKIFFEKNGQPYNDFVSFKVTCYGYISDNTDPNRKNYWRGNYVRREPGTYNQTEVFSYSATVDHYGDEIFEPFYLNYRVIDYCSLCGETDGKEFLIENIGGSPIPNCSSRPYPVDYRSDDDMCHIPTEQYTGCYCEQEEMKWEEVKSCDKYLEKFDKKKLYPPDTKTRDTSEGTMVITREYTECRDKVNSIDLNCSVFLEDVACADISDPDGNPIQRDCSLYFEIPAYENGTIIGTDAEIPVVYSGIETVYRYNSWLEEISGEGFDLFSFILEFFGTER
jgi:hypothetical protein